MASAANPLQSESRIAVRPANSNDVPKMASTAFIGYAGSPLEQYLSPSSAQYPGDALRAWHHVMTLRWLDPRMVSIVACPASAPDNIVGYAQFFRAGDDEGANRQIAFKRTFWQSVVIWYYIIKFKIVDFLWPDRSVNPTAKEQYKFLLQIGDATHWNSIPERKNRWHLRSIVVSPKYRGRGIGTLLINDLLDRARIEGVVVGLEASADGEHLYRKVGFKLLSRFYQDTGSEVRAPDGGGFMMWTPEKMKDS